MVGVEYTCGAKTLVITPVTSGLETTFYSGTYDSSTSGPPLARKASVAVRDSRHVCLALQRLNSLLLNFDQHAIMEHIVNAARVDRDFILESSDSQHAFVNVQSYILLMLREAFKSAKDHSIFSANILHCTVSSCTAALESFIDLFHLDKDKFALVSVLVAKWGARSKKDLQNARYIQAKTQHSLLTYKESFQYAEIDLVAEMCAQHTIGHLSDVMLCAGLGRAYNLVSTDDWRAQIACMASFNKASYNILWRICQPCAHITASLALNCVVLAPMPIATISMRVCLVDGGNIACGDQQCDSAGGKADAEAYLRHQILQHNNGEVEETNRGPMNALAQASISKGILSRS